ncbi:transmembrane protein 42-like isoform X2 [Myxocyprinus asiaticus]|uniref:transmembrane protein 42-like isoform X2 n=1 Tax=Myxocyprinus asiaticus TaxID=70543 RepID=UPI002223373C|nr:transmembrane protein 42-like isoform X2 [Myxocyprinus asiaticus]
MLPGVFYALVAGFLAALASSSAKLSLGADYLKELCGGLLFTCNAVMCTFFAKALRHSSSSAQATVTTTASNFISPAFLGYVIFGETRHIMVDWYHFDLNWTSCFAWINFSDYSGKCG